MEIVLQNLQHEKCFVYLEHVTIKGKPFEEALANLRELISEMCFSGSDRLI